MEIKDLLPDWTDWEWIEEHINKHYRSSYFSSLRGYYGEYPEEVTASWSCALMAFAPEDRKSDFNSAVRLYIRKFCRDIRQDIEAHMKNYIWEVEREYKTVEVE